MGGGQLSGAHTRRIPLRAVVADEGFPHAVVAVRDKVPRKELPGVGLIVELAQHRVVLIVGTGGIQAHLEVLVIHIYFMEGKLHIAVHAEAPFPAGIVPDPDVKDFHRVFISGFPRNKQDLLRADVLVIALEAGIAQAVPRFIFGFIQQKARGLPAQGPVLPAFIVPQVDVVSRPVHGNAVGAETGNPVMLRAVQPAVASGIMGNHGAHSLGTQIVCHGNRHVDPVNHVFACGIIEISVTHIEPPALYFSL